MWQSPEELRLYMTTSPQAHELLVNNKRTEINTANFLTPSYFYSKTVVLKETNWEYKTWR